LSSLGTATTNRTIVTAPGNYDDGEIGKIIVWQGKPKYSERTWPSAALSITNPTRLLGREYGPPRWESRD
jgi:hypothetical protein